MFDHGTATLEEGLTGERAATGPQVWTNDEYGMTMHNLRMRLVNRIPNPYPKCSRFREWEREFDYSRARGQVRPTGCGRTPGDGH